MELNHLLKPYEDRDLTVCPIWHTKFILRISITQDTPRGGFLNVSLAEAGLEPTISTLWGSRDNHFSTPQYKNWEPVVFYLLFSSYTTT